MGSGTKPRARRRKAGAPSTMRSTESSARAYDLRARERPRDRRSPASFARASSLSAISGSPPRLALVATSAMSEGAARHAAKSGEPASACKHQPVQRRIGQHHADRVQAGRDAGRQAAPAPQQHDRRGADASAGGADPRRVQRAAPRSRCSKPSRQMALSRDACARAAGPPPPRCARRRTDGSRRRPSTRRCRLRRSS